MMKKKLKGFGGIRENNQNFTKGMEGQNAPGVKGSQIGQGGNQGQVC